MPAHRLWMKSGASGRAKDFDYAAGIEFKETCDAVIRTMDSLPKR